MKFTFNRLLLLCLLLSVWSTDIISNTTPITDKEAKCLAVFNKLKKVKGILPMQPPFLKMVPGALPNRRFVLAMARNSTAEIFIQESAYDMCIDSLGEHAQDGLAFLLAHELAHYTRKHNLRHQFIKDFQRGVSRDTGFIRSTRMMNLRNDQNTLDSLFDAYRAIERSYQVRKNEAEADLDAGFTCYLAGYKTKVAGPLFLDKAYKKYTIDEKGGDYASKEERKEIVRRTAKSLDSLIHVFELGNYLTTSGHIEEAIDCYDYVTKIYPSKEILNNAGILGILHITKNMSAPDLRFAFPLTLDLQEMAIGASRDIFDMSPEEEAIWLKEQKLLLDSELRYLYQSIAYFDQASSMDDNYYVGELNKSIANVIIHFVKSDYSEVEEFMEDDLIFAETAALKAKQIAMKNKDENAKGLSDIYTMLAIINEYRGRNSNALALIQKAVEFVPANELGGVARVNKKVLEGDRDAVMDFMFGNQVDKFKLCSDEELVMGTKTLEQAISEDVGGNWDAEFHVKTNVKGLLPVNTMVKYKELKDCTIYSIEDVRGTRIKKQIQFLRTKSNYSHTSVCDIEKGSTLEDIKDEYGNPLSVIQTVGGSLMHFTNIIFHLDSDSKVKSWIVYKEQ